MNCPHCSEEMTVVDVVGHGDSRGLLLTDPTTTQESPQLMSERTFTPIDINASPTDTLNTAINNLVALNTTENSALSFGDAIEQLRLMTNDVRLRSNPEYQYQRALEVGQQLGLPERFALATWVNDEGDVELGVICNTFNRDEDTGSRLFLHISAGPVCKCPYNTYGVHYGDVAMDEAGFTFITDINDEYARIPEGLSIGVVDGEKVIYSDQLDSRSNALTFKPDLNKYPLVDPYTIDEVSIYYITEA